MRKKILIWAGTLVFVCVVGLIVYWYTEPDIWIQPNKVVIVSQLEGDSTTIDVPVENYAEVLEEFTLKTQIRSYEGLVLKETDTVLYEPMMQYKFVTYKQLPKGRYEARAIVGYRRNPLSYRELNLPLAIIYVRKPDDNLRTIPEVHRLQ